MNGGPSPRDAGAPARRTLQILSVALYFTLTGLNLLNLPIVLALDEPRRTVRLTMALLSYLAGLFGVVLFVRDFRGRVMPVGTCLKPAWLVVGLSLLDAYFASRNVSFLVVGLSAVAVGLWAIGTLLAGRRGKAVG